MPVVVPERSQNSHPAPKKGPAPFSPPTRYTGYDLDETSYSDAGTVDGDTILEQAETAFDDTNNRIKVVTRQRYHNAPVGQTGELKDPSTTPKARVTYVANYQDALGRQIARADYGTNGGTALARSNTIPARSDTILVTSNGYNSSGNLETTTDPAARITRSEHDAVGREVKQIMNYVAASSSSSSSSSSGDCPDSLDTNVTVNTAYNADGNVSSITAINSITGDQKTEYVYGTTLSDSDIAISTLKRAEVYPDSVDQSDRITFEYNRQRQVTKTTDQQGTTHEFDFDKLARQVQDRVTTLGTGVDASVRRIASTFEVRGMREKLTSYNNAQVGHGNIVSEVQFTYNDFGQLTHDYQSHSGAVNTSTTPKVQYAYANGSANTIRPTSITYPEGRVITYAYGTTNGTNDAASRIESIVGDDVASTHLADYAHLGQGLFVEVDYSEPDIKYTLVGTAGVNDPDTGDIYLGFDRFGRVKDNYWYDYGSTTDVDRIKYGYDRAGNRIWRENTVAARYGMHFDELYAYDSMHRLKHMDRGQLDALKNAVSNLQFAQCWELDETGNWSNFREDDDGNSSWDLVQNRTNNKVNEITDFTETTGPSWVTPAYSKAGNMTTVPKTADPTAAYTCIYDAWNRLIRIEEGDDTVAQYEYDGAKRRAIKETYSGGALDETRHLYYTEPSRWQVVEERVDASSNPDRQFVWGLRYIDDMVLRDRDTTGDGSLDERLYGLQDANWNLTSIADITGTVQERYLFSAYGIPLFLDSSFNNRASSSYAWETLFAGYRWDGESNLFQIRNRAYNPYLGMWLQRDPAKTDTIFYAYVSENPAIYTDAFGLFVLTAAATLVLGGKALAALAASVGLTVAALMAILAIDGVIDIPDSCRSPLSCRVLYPSLPSCGLLRADAVAAHMHNKPMTEDESHRWIDDIVDDNFGSDTSPPTIAPATSCPGDELGFGVHANVSDGDGNHIGSILCCPCCQGRSLETRCRVDSVV